MADLKLSLTCFTFYLIDEVTYRSDLHNFCDFNPDECKVLTWGFNQPWLHLADRDVRLYPAQWLVTVINPTYRKSRWKGTSS